MNLVSILFTAKNRLAFTKEAFTALRLNTDWQVVDSLYVYDDASEDGTWAWLRRECKSVPTRAHVAICDMGSPVLITNLFLEESGESRFIAKIDNDTLVPHAWLRIGLSIFEHQPELECLGLEHWGLEGSLPHVGKPTDSTGGLFLARRSAFPLDDLPKPDGDRGGLQKYQWKRRMKCAWIQPSIPVVLMDRIPVEPYASLNKEYLAKGWQRPWPHNYKSEQHALWDWWTDRQQEADAA